MTKIKEIETVDKLEKSTVPTKPIIIATKYAIEKLRENCMQLFNVSTSTFDGAAYGLKGSYTIDEMKAIINKWKSKEVI